MRYLGLAQCISLLEEGCGILILGPSGKQQLHVHHGFLLQYTHLYSCM